MSYDLVVIADLCIDILLTGEDAPEFGQVEKFVNDYHLGLGGSASIFAAQFRKLGSKPAFFGLTGKDAFGDILIRQLRALNIDTTFIDQSSTCKTALGLGLVKGEDRAMLTYKGCLQEVSMDRVLASGIFSKANHIHICGFYLLEHLKNDWTVELKKLKAKGVTISLDTNWAPNEDWETVHDLLPMVDVFIPNEEEAIRISGKATYKLAGHWLSQYGALVVIKRGASGASVFQKGKVTEYPIPASLTQNLDIKDTTGAGDNFCAGFIHAWLLDESVEDCVNLAMKCGTLSLRKMGGIEGQWCPETIQRIFDP